MRCLRVGAVLMLAAWGAISGCGRGEPSDGPGAPPGAAPAPGPLAALTALFPPSGAAAGWEVFGAGWNAVGRQLYDPIDGAAEAYLQYDFIAAASRQYVKNGDAANPIEVSLFRFATSAEAFGAYSTIRQSRKPLAVGDAGVYEDGTLEFHQGLYFVRVVAVEHTPELFAAVKTLAEAISKGIPERMTALPAVFDVLPTERRVAGSEQYAHTGFSLNRIQSGFATKPLDLSRETEIAAAEYGAENTPADERNAVFAIRYRSVEAATAAFEAYRGDFPAQAGRVGQSTVVQREGAWLVGSWRKAVEERTPVLPAIVQRIRAASATRP
jgi:hypothetical protein